MDITKKNKITIGRTPDNDIAINESKVSRNHAVIMRISDNVFLIEDLNSSNGTFVNNRRVKRKIITKNDNLVIGSKTIDLNTLSPKKITKTETKTQKIKSVYKIGRDINNDIVINHKSVSRVHAILKVISTTEFEITDNNSSFGISINQKKVQKSKFSTNDTLNLGNFHFIISEHIDLSKYKSVKSKSEKGKLSPEEQEEVYKQFDELKEVYGTYRDFKFQKKKGKAWKRSGVRAAFALIPFVGNAIGIMATNTIDDSEKLMAVEEEFKIHYVCPKCKRFLGFLPWDNLKNEKMCWRCKVQWVKE